MDREQLIKHIQDKFPGKVELLETGKVEPIFKIELDFLIEFCTAVRDDEQLEMDMMCNIAGVDTGEQFEIVYSLASVKNKIRFDFKVIPDRDKPEIDTVINIWPGANWYEREIWELYGIGIKNHPFLKQFLLPDNWDQGYPMRKDWDAPDFVRLPEN